MVTPSASPPPPSEQRRLARASRSPVSLQRQTNARLARHRLKIKQQRLDQLATLALMEREQLARERRREQIARARQGERRTAAAGRSMPSTCTTSTSDTSSSSNPAQSVTGDSNDDYLRIDIEEILVPDTSDQLAATDNSASGQNGFLRDLFARLSNRSNASSVDSSRNEWRRRQQQQQAQDPSGTALIGLDVVDSGQHQQQAVRQQLAPAQTSDRSSVVALEICDNQENGTRGLYRHRRSYRSSRTSSSAPNQNQRRQRADNIVSTQLTSELIAPASAQMASSKRHLTAFKFSPESSDLLPDNASSSPSTESTSTLSLNKPFCKICHLSSNRNGHDKLISPCKCSGTMQYVHCGCLLKWLEISNRTNEKPISCELCSHEYTWHKRFNYNHIKLPRCSAKDMVLHLVFVLALIGMVCCALAPLFHGGASAFDARVTASAVMVPDIVASHSVPMTQDLAKFSGEHNQGNSRAKNGNSMKAQPGSFGSTRQQQNGVTTFSFPTGALPSSSMPINNSKLASDEKFVLACAALFFVSFFIAIYAQSKTRDTLYGLIVKFTNMNMTYFITEYDHGTNHTSSYSESTTNTGNNNSSSSSNHVIASSHRNEINQCGDSEDYRYDRMTEFSQDVTSAASQDHNDASPQPAKNGTNNKHPQR